MMYSMTFPGQVWAHVGQAFHETDFDVVIVGAGRMGAAAALYLRQLAPQLSLLMVEEGGLPNEEAATLLAPGLWTTLDLPPARLAQAQWTRRQLETAFGHVQFSTRPLIELAPEAAPDRASSLRTLNLGKPSLRPSSAELLADYPEAAALLDLTALPLAQLDEQAATFRPGSVALSAAQQAIRLGANLLLNTRANLSPAGLTLERLTVTNTHQIVTHETKSLRAGLTVIAAGAAGPALVEHGLGQHTRHARAYQQYPRLSLPSHDQTPALRVQGLTLRPQQGGWTLVPRIHHRDPHGYVPAGGKLTGVPTGLRREVLEDLVALMPAVPALTGEELQVGRSLSDLPGAWVALPNGQPGAPQWEEISPGYYLLLGGPQADTLGLAVAHDLAQTISGGVRPVPKG